MDLFDKIIVGFALSWVGLLVAAIIRCVHDRKRLPSLMWLYWLNMESICAYGIELHHPGLWHAHPAIVWLIMLAWGGCVIGIPVLSKKAQQSSCPSVEMPDVKRQNV